MARQACRETESLTNLTDASHIATVTPPEWRLRDANVKSLAGLPLPQGSPISGRSMQSARSGPQPVLVSTSLLPGHFWLLGVRSVDICTVPETGIHSRARRSISLFGGPPVGAWSISMNNSV